MRRVTPAQLNSLIRQEEARQRQAISRYNAEVRRHNQQIEQAAKEEKAAIDRYNREARAHNQRVEREAREAERKENAAIDRFSRDVRAYNERVRTHQRRLEAELRRLDRQSAPQQLITVRDSATSLNRAFREVEAAASAEGWGQRRGAIVDLAEAETANSAGAANVLLGGEPQIDEPIEETTLGDELRVISPELDDRWQGARYAINPRNPDAARHFCTSSREIITEILDLKAPDDAVLSAIPSCDKTEHGKPVRRAKIDYLLMQTSLSDEHLADFVETDVVDVSGLFRVFNDGTHGSAGTYDVAALRALKSRVEGTIQFLSVITRDA